MKKLILFSSFLALLSCTCLPQIPTQVLYLDSTCTVTVPDYITIFTVYDNCTNHIIIQYPPAGTILHAPDNFSVDIIARDDYDNSAAVTFNVEVLDTIPPVLQYIGDTTTTHHQNDIDGLIESYEVHRSYLGDTIIRKSFTVYY